MRQGAIVYLILPQKNQSLKGNLTGLWSRRIDLEHRLVYAVMDDTIHVVGCRFHY
ncbi:Txe/YoeB family addiction module toxin [Duganella sp. HH101]|uniref:Txe/YoeB family addiction module toxin n=1 Tax=Duganella sp. HH101 TaxID=1781066 RepID=UPI0009F5E8B4|nr:Txe/YoeB family addiction module toxin [Duganella sp. HH101]